jgi:hypothetical protein
VTSTKILRFVLLHHYTAAFHVMVTYLDTEISFAEPCRSGNKTVGVPSASKKAGESPGRRFGRWAVVPELRRRGARLTRINPMILHEHGSL